MQAACDDLLRDILQSPTLRREILSDPRPLHRRLFSAFAPADFPDYAGVYRGEAGTSLAKRRMSAPSELWPGEGYEFVAPAEVPSRMATLLDTLDRLAADPKAEDFGRLVALSYAFCWFGKIHPFLDGNGHVQRALFAALATEFGYPLSARFAIHPRPFDRLLAMALERFARSSPGEENAELGLVAEYLAFFLDGPFAGVRRHVATLSPYV